MYKKSLNRTITSSRMTVFENQGRFSELQKKRITNFLVTFSQKPVADFAKNKNCSNLQLSNSAFIMGSEEKIPEMNLSSVSTINRSWQNRFCISVSKNRQAKFSSPLPRLLFETTLIWEILNMTWRIHDNWKKWTFFMVKSYGALRSIILLKRCWL